MGNDGLASIRADLATLRATTMRMVDGQSRLFEQRTSSSWSDLGDWRAFLVGAAIWMAGAGLLQDRRRGFAMLLVYPKIALRSLLSIAHWCP